MTVPTALERQGIFDPQRTGRAIRDPLTGRPFPNNTIPSGRIDPVAAKLVALYPLPNFEGSGRQNYTASPLDAEHRDQFDFRVDHQFSANDRMFVRYSFMDHDERREGPFPLPLLGIGNNTRARDNNVAHSVAVSETHIVDPRLVNEVRFGVSRLETDKLPLSTAVGHMNDEFGIRGIPRHENVPGLPQIQLAGAVAYANIGDVSFSPNLKLSQTFHLMDNVTYLAGEHSLKAGADYRFFQTDVFGSAQARGRINFNGRYTGVSLELGSPGRRHLQSDRPHRLPRGRRHLLWRAGERRRVEPAAGKPAVLRPCDQARYRKAARDNAAGGIPGRLSRRWSGHPPRRQRQQLGGRLSRHSDQPVDAERAARAARANRRVSGVRREHRRVPRARPRVQRRGIGDPETEPQRRPVPHLGSIALRAPRAHSNQLSPAAKIDRRFSRGLGFLVSYTWGHALDNAGEPFGQDTGVGTPWDLENDYASFDIRHRFVSSVLWEVPVGQDRRWLDRGGLANTLLGEWQVNATVTAQTGLPFTPEVSDSYSHLGTLGVVSWWPDRLRDGSLPDDQRSAERWFDASAFAIPCDGDERPCRQGTAGRNILRAPGQSISISR